MYPELYAIYMGRFELFEHTADIGVRAFGADLADAFAYAALGMFEVVTNVDSIGSVGEIEIELDASDIEELLIRFLSELLFLLDTRKMIMSEFEIEINEPDVKLKAKVKGETFDPKKHEYKTEIKAVTHHILEIKKLEEPVEEGDDEEKYMVQVLLDI
jgi:SHS2 domain-containing protein